MGIDDGSDGYDVQAITIATNWTCAQLKSLWGSTHNNTYKTMYTNQNCFSTDGNIDSYGGSMGCVQNLGSGSGLGIGIADACSSY